jgi:hypothetical protein
MPTNRLTPHWFLYAGTGGGGLTIGDPFPEKTRAGLEVSMELQTGTKFQRRPWGGHINPGSVLGTTKNRGRAK